MTCYYSAMVIDKNNNSQSSTQDDDPTLELEPLSEEACAQFERSGALADQCDPIADMKPLPSAHGEASTDKTGADPSLIQELRDELKFRDEINSILQSGIDQQSEKCSRLTKEISRQRKTNEKLLRKLEQSRNKTSKARKKLEKSRESERALLANLKKLGQPSAPNTAVIDRTDSVGELRNENRRLTDALSSLEGKLEVAAQNTSLLESRLNEATAGSTKLLDTLELRNAEVGDFKRQLRGLQNRSNGGGQFDSEGNDADVPTANGRTRDRWVLVGLDSMAPDTYIIRDGVVTVGSSPDSDIRFESKFVSRHHAQLIKTENGCLLGDSNSTNGTFVNSRQINKRVLRAGDIVTFGKHKFRYEKQSVE